MRYQYTYRTSAWDLWQLSMYYTYGSLVGVCNLIFTVAVILLAFKQWETAGTIYKIILVLGCGLFTVIQPLIVYFRAKRQAETIKEDTELGFDDDGVYIKSGSQDSELTWDKIKKVSKKPTMIIIFSNTTHGFVLTNQVLGGEKSEFYKFITSKVKGQS